MKEKSTARTVTEGNSDPKDMALAVEQVVCRWMLVSILATLKVSAISPSILITVLERPTTKNCQPNQPYTLLLHAHLLYPPLSSSSKSWKYAVKRVLPLQAVSTLKKVPPPESENSKPKMLSLKILLKKYQNCLNPSKLSSQTLLSVNAVQRNCLLIYFL